MQNCYIHAESGIKSNLKLSRANDIVQFLALLPVYLRIEDRDRVSIFLSQKLESSIFKKFDLFDHSTPECVIVRLINNLSNVYVRPGYQYLEH